MKHVELEQFLHPFELRRFVSVSWTFLFSLCSIQSSLSILLNISKSHTVILATEYG